MDLLKRKITYRQVVQWGAANSLGEKFIKDLFGGNKSLFIKEIIEADAHPHFKNWTLIRLQVLTPKVMHEIALHYAEEFLKSAKKKGVHIDFRIERLLKAKQKWINQEISTGALRVNQQEANQIANLVSQLNDNDASQVARVIECALLDDPTECYELVYINVSDFKNVIKEHLKGEYSKIWTDRLGYLRKQFNSLNKNKAFLAEQDKKIAKGSKHEKTSQEVVGSNVPIGTILAYAGTNPSELESKGWLVCDGRTLPASDYNELSQAIGTAFGSPDEENFNIPDLRGVFLRGVSGDSTNDPDKDSRLALQPNGNTGNQIGSYQDYATAKPKIDFTATITNGNSGSGNYDGGCQGHAGKDSGTTTITANAGGGLESRPKNKYVYYIIKYATLGQERKEVDIPIGAIIPFSGAEDKTITLNWVHCDGTLLNGNPGEFSALFSAIGFSNGGAANNEFMLPDYQGYFLRGVATAGGKDPNSTIRTAPNPDSTDYPGNIGEAIGSVQEDITALPHTAFTTDVTAPTGETGKIIEGVIRNLYKYNSGSVLTAVTNGGGDSETRPVNYAVDWYIRFR